MTPEEFKRYKEGQQENTEAKNDTSKKKGADKSTDKSAEKGDKK